MLAPAAIGQETLPGAAELRERLVDELPPALVEDGGCCLFWNLGSRRLLVVGVEQGEPVIATPAGRVAVAGELLRWVGGEVADALAGLVERAGEAPGAWRYEWDELTGYRLAGARRIAFDRVLARTGSDDSAAARVEAVRRGGGVREAAGRRAAGVLKRK